MLCCSSYWLGRCIHFRRVTDVLQVLLRYLRPTQSSIHFIVPFNRRIYTLHCLTTEAISPRPHRLIWYVSAECIVLDLIVFSSHVRICTIGIFPFLWFRLQRPSNKGQSVPENEIFTLDEVEIFGLKSGIFLKAQITGPALRLEAFVKDDLDNKIGYLTCFIRPFTRLLQLETIQVPREMYPYWLKFFISTCVYSYLRSVVRGRFRFSYSRNSQNYLKIYVKIYINWPHHLLGRF